MKKLLTREVKIGIAGIIALCLVIYGINFLKGINMFKPTHFFYVKFDNILGLTQSSTVFADGFRIGLVRSIHYDYEHPGNVIVEVQLDDEMRIPKGSYGELSTEMLGGVNMNIILPRGVNEYYAQGDTIPGRAKSGLMDDVSDNMLPQVSNLLPKIDSILTQVNRLLANQNIPTAMEELRKTSENLSVATAHLKTFAGEDLPKLSQRMDRIGANVETVTGKLSELEFAETMDKVNATMANVEQMTTRLTSRDNTIGLMLNDDSLYTNLNRTASNASLLLQDLREHPKRYVHFSLFGRKDK